MTRVVDLEPYIIQDWTKISSTVCKKENLIMKHM